MEKDEQKQDVDLEKNEVVDEETEETEAKGSEGSESEEADYRGKLNATNRFLQKEGYEFKEGKWIKPAPKEKAPKEKEEKSEKMSLSPKSIIALAKANIHEDDYDKVLDYAAYKKVDPAVAMKDDVLKTILADSAEKRRSSEVAATKSAKGSSKVSDETILENAAKGILSEDDAAIDRLVKAEMAQKMKK